MQKPASKPFGAEVVEILEDGSDGHVHLKNGKVIQVVEKGELTDEAVEFVLDLAFGIQKDGMLTPKVEKYVGPNIYIEDPF